MFNRKKVEQLRTELRSERIVAGNIIEDNTRLTKDNAELRREIFKLKRVTKRNLIVFNDKEKNPIAITFDKIIREDDKVAFWLKDEFVFSHNKGAVFSTKRLDLK